MTVHILIVEDDRVTRMRLAVYLRGLGYRVTEVEDAEAMQEVIDTDPPELLLLDIGLEGKDGLTITREQRARSRVGIILLTSRDEQVDRIVGLEMGADDYVTKPFDRRELAARIKNLLSRITDIGRSAPKRDAIEEFGPWRFDRIRRRLVSAARIEPLSGQEFDLLDVLTRNPGVTFAFTAAGGEVVGQEWPAFQKTQDFGPFLANAKASGADAVYVFFAGGEAISFVKQYDSFGLKAELPLYGSGFLTSALYVEAEGPAAEGVITALHYVPTLDNPENAAFVAAFKEKTGRIPSEYAVQGYDSARALVEAVKSGATDRETLAAALPKVSFTGPRGELRIDPATNNIVQPIHVYETVAGADGLTQKVLATLPAEADPVNGCAMPAAAN